MDFYEWASQVADMLEVDVEVILGMEQVQLLLYDGHVSPKEAAEYIKSEAWPG